MTAIVYLDELLPKRLGPDGTLAGYLDGKLIQSAEPPPDFVEPTWIRRPDVVWRWTVSKQAAVRPRWTPVSSRSLPAVAPVEWLERLTEHRPRPERLQVARALATYADHGTGKNVRPAVGTLARQVGRSRPRVNGHLSALHDAGWLARTGKAQKGVVIYALTIPTLEVEHNQ